MSDTVTHTQVWATAQLLEDALHHARVCQETVAGLIRAGAVDGDGLVLASELDAALAELVDAAGRAAERARELYREVRDAGERP